MKHAFVELRNLSLHAKFKLKWTSGIQVMCIGIYINNKESTNV